MDPMIEDKTDLPDNPITADRFADRAMLSMAFLHLIAGLLFLFTLTIASFSLTETASAAGQYACQGNNLVHQLEREDPAKLVAIKAGSEEFRNGEAILWKISREGIEPSWLFGTMHSADQRILGLMDRIRPQFEAATSVIIENTDSVEGKNSGAALAAMKKYAFLEAGTTLENLVSEPDLSILKRELESRHMPWTSARHMQPWLVTASIAIPVCDLKAKASGIPVLDAQIGAAAMEQGKTLVGLESVEEQLSAVSSIPFEFHLNALNETLKLSHLSDDLMETTKALYLEGKIGWMLPLVRSFAPQTYTGKGYAEFQKLLLTSRNHRMAERAAEHLEKGNVFMAVGALHLPGEEGLVELLRKSGFTLEPVAL